MHGIYMQLIFSYICLCCLKKNGILVKDRGKGGGDYEVEEAKEKLYKEEEGKTKETSIDIYRNG